MAFSFRAGTNWCHDFPKLARDSGFHFNMHRSRVRVDWNRIGSIDIDRVIRERDFSIIDDNVNNVVDYCMESEYDVKILDPNFVKLFRIAQLAVEYLLYCKQYLDHSVIILKDELRSKLEENVKLKKDYNSSEETIKELKEKLKERTRVIETKLSDSHGEIHKCPHCPKTFISAIFMNAHVNRRHPNLSHLSSNSPVHEQYRAEAEKLHNEIKSLKERLNQTERVIRNESDKMLRFDSVVSTNRDKDIDKSEGRNTREQDERIEEQHRRYQEEISNLKTTLFTEIRNLKLGDRYNWGKQDNDDYNNGNLKELFRQQENEIQRLRDQLHKRLAPDIEGIQAKLDNQEDHWRSKIDYLENRHRMDIEKLYTQLKVTQESADQMRIDYISKMNDLERRSRSDSNLISGRNALSEKFLSNPIRNSPIRTRNARRGSVNSLPITSDQNRYFIREKRQNDSTNRHSNGDKVSNDVKNGEELVVEDIDSASSKDTINAASPISSKKTHQRSADDEKSVDKVTSLSGNKDRSKRKNKIHEKTSSSLPRKSDETLRNGFHDSLPNSDSSKRRIIDKQELSSLDSVDYGVKDSGKFSDTDNISRESPAHRSTPDLTSRKSKNSLDSRGIDAVEKGKNNVVEKSSAIRENEGKSESEESDSGSESSSESESVDSEVAARSQNSEEDSEESELSQVEADSTNRKRHNQRTNVDNDTRDTQEFNESAVEQFESKLRELGIDPEWQGIPNATFKQLMEIVRHHRNLNSKKYHKFDEIRRKLIEEVTRKISAQQKVTRIDRSMKRSSIDKLMTNVKNKAYKALNILEKNEGSHSARSLSSNNGSRDEKLSAHKSTLDLLPTKMSEKEVRGIKSESPRGQTNSRGSEERQRTRPVPRIPDATTYERYSAAPSKSAGKLGDSTNDIKHLSHSYESIKDFLKDANSQKQQRSPFSVTGTVVTSTPHKNETNSTRDSISIANDASGIQIIKQHENIFSLPGSPRNNKSVLKSTSGSVGSLVKKKVLFDLESTASPDKIDDERKYSSKPEESNREKDNLSESDFDISSISEEKDQIENTRESSQSGNIVLKTSQSEKIAQISKQIEEQLSIARRKPAGAVEAMFMEKFSFKNEKSDSRLNSYPNSASGTSSVAETPTRQFQTKFSTETRFPQPAPRTRANPNSESPKTQDYNFERKDSNLDMDIDELLRME